MPRGVGLLLGLAWGCASPDRTPVPPLAPCLSLPDTGATHGSGLLEQVDLTAVEVLEVSRDADVVEQCDRYARADEANRVVARLAGPDGEVLVGLFGPGVELDLAAGDVVDARYSYEENKWAPSPGTVAFRRDGELVAWFGEELGFDQMIPPAELAVTESGGRRRVGNECARWFELDAEVTVSGETVEVGYGEVASVGGGTFAHGGAEELIRSTGRCDDGFFPEAVAMWWREP